MSRGKPWKTTEEGYLRQHYSQQRTQHLAHVLGRSVNAIRVKAKRLKLRRPTLIEFSGGLE